MAEKENVWKMNAFVSCYKMQEKTTFDINKVEKSCDETAGVEIRYMELQFSWFILS